MALKDDLKQRFDPVTCACLNSWHDLCEKDDRTSPEDYPDHCLITYDELSGYIRAACAEVSASKIT